MRDSSWNSIATSIKGAIQRGDLSAGARIASETEMATQWNVSPMTVHRALSELQREGWVIRRSKTGTVVADREAHPMTKIGLVFPTLESAYLAGIEDALGAGYQLLPFRTNHTASEEARVLEQIASACDAVICYATGDPVNAPLFTKVAKSRPLLFVDRSVDGVEADVIATDNAGSLIHGLKFLYASDHRRIAYLMGSHLYISSVNERREGYTRFMRDIIGVADTEELVRVLPPGMPTKTNYARVEVFLAELLSGPNPITAIACQQDMMLAAVLEGCVHLGISVPGELAVLGFDDTSYNNQPLACSAHRLVQRLTEMGHMAAKRIQLRLANADLPVQETRIMADFYPAKPHQRTPEGDAFVAARANARQ